MDLKAGTRLRSTVCSTEVVVVRPPTAPVDLRCGGAPMATPGPQPPAPVAATIDGPGTQLGKRYADPGSSLEVLCTKGGEGSLALGDEPLLRKDAKPLPSSD